MTKEHSKNIVLIGFTSCGKTATGRLLADTLSWKFIDLDSVIQDVFDRDANERLTCRQIYKQYGSKYFRQLEVNALHEVTDLQQTVFSTGGGAPLAGENRPLLSALGTIIYLTAEPKVILQRMQSKGMPAFLEDDPTLSKLTCVLTERHPVYKELSDFSIDTSSLGHEAVVEEIVIQLQIQISGHRMNFRSL
jgi:shikimate kinase